MDRNGNLRCCNDEHKAIRPEIYNYRVTENLIIQVKAKGFDSISRDIMSLHPHIPLN